jgi:hypothetical protein
MYRLSLPQGISRDGRPACRYQATFCYRPSRTPGLTSKPNGRASIHSGVSSARLQACSALQIAPPLCFDCPAKEGTMEEAVRLNAGRSASDEADTNSLRRCEHALELLLTHRGNPAPEVERILVDDPKCVFAHCLRAAIIVCGDSIRARSSLAASVSAIGAACPDENKPALRHAAAARACLDGDQSLALDYYGAIVIDWPRDVRRYWDGLERRVPPLRRSQTWSNPHQPTSPAGC